MTNVLWAGTIFPEVRRLYIYMPFGVFKLDDSLVQCNLSHLKICCSYSWSSMKVYEHDYKYLTFPGKIHIFHTKTF